MGIDIKRMEKEISPINNEQEPMKEQINIDSKHVSKVLVELAEEDLRCPDNRQYVSMSGVIKVKSKVQTQY